MRKVCVACGGLCGARNLTGYCALCCTKAKKCVLDGCDDQVSSASKSGLCHACNTEKTRRFVKSKAKDARDSERKSILRERLPAWIKKHVRVISRQGKSGATIVDFNRFTLRIKFKIDSNSASYSKPLYAFLDSYELEPE
jgi:hypothetical protein